MIALTEGCRSWSSSRQRRPSMPGIRRSRSTMSGEVRLTRGRISCPAEASPTISMSGASLNAMRTAARISGWSSAISTFRRMSDPPPLTRRRADDSVVSLTTRTPVGAIDRLRFGDRADRSAIRAPGTRNRGQVRTRLRQLGEQEIDLESELFESSSAHRAQLEPRSPNVADRGADGVHVVDIVSAWRTKVTDTFVSIPPAPGSDGRRATPLGVDRVARENVFTVDRRPFDGIVPIWGSPRCPRSRTSPSGS